jgi:DNA primase large subunit
VIYLLLPRTDLAKYPFLNEASDYVRELGFSIDEIAAPEFSTVLDRAESRLEEALSKGRVSSDTANEDAEILSFPVSNLILSLVGEDRAQRRFAMAESKRAYELLRHEPPEKIEYIATTTFGWKISRVDVQLEVKFYDFGLSVPDFLRNSIHMREARWKLSNRVLDHGLVYMSKEETARLMEEEVRNRILERAAKTPSHIPTELLPRVERTRALITKWLGVPVKYELPQIPVPEAMPPCVLHVMDQLGEGKNVQHMGRFALATFLLNIGTKEDEVVKQFKPATDFSERMTRYQVEHIAGRRGGRTKYTCPMCTTLKTHGVCYKPDEVCSTIRNPLSYYKKKTRILTGRGPKREPN